MSLDTANDEIVLQAPPALPREGGGGFRQSTQMLFMLPMMLGMGAMSFLYIGRSGGPMTVVFGGLFAASTLGMLVMGLARAGGQRRAQINEERRDYLRYLHSLRDRVGKVAREQREEMCKAMPAPEDLWALTGTPKLWHLNQTDPRFGLVRVATGSQLLATPLRAPQTAPVEDLDPVSSTALRRFIRTHGSVQGLPVALSLRAFPRISLSGHRADVLDLARAVVAQLVTFHHPSAMRLVCCGGVDWEWLKWLPHSAWAPDPAALAELLGAELAQRPPFNKHQTLPPDQQHIVVLLDASGDTSFVDDRLGVTVLDLAGGETGLELVIDGDRLGRRTSLGIAPIGRVDRLGAAQAEVVARQLTALTPIAAADEAPAVAGLGLADLLGVGDPRTLNPAVSWTGRSARARLRIPIGVNEMGRPVELDLKESAEGGMGPHGLVIGATGSGKSELLRTLVTGLVVTHSSEAINLALVDFKGGATFAGMTDLPHTCAVITNLADDLTMVDRMGDALRGEMVRRQELLRDSGNFAAVRDYEVARLGGAALPPLPSLLVIIDEFSELLSGRPELIDLFVMIGRLGRSLGIHLLFASQNLDEGRLRGLDTHLSYRIALRTFSASASRAVIGVSDAYELPPEPGAAFLRVDTNTLTRFKCAYVSGPLPATRIVEPKQPIASYHRVTPFTFAPPSKAPQPVAAVVTETSSQTVMQAMLGRLMGQGPAAHQIWLPPLDEPSTLDAMLPGLTATPDRGFTVPGWSGVGRLSVPIAMVDKPVEQRRDLMWTELAGAAGHVAVVGAPQSGKSTLLRTLVAMLALTHTPKEVQFFLLDFGGGGLSTLAGLPHVSGSAGRLDTEACRRTVAEIKALLAERERLFAERGIDSMAAFRREPVRTGDRDFGDVFLVVDGWMTLRQEYEELEEAVTAIAARGLGYGVHLVLSANRWMEVRSALSDLIGTKFELRLGDPSDSMIDRRIAANVPNGAPGRGLTPDSLHFLGALPRVDGQPSTEDLASGVTDLVTKVAAAWSGPRAPVLRLLPRLVPASDLPATGLPIGIAESDLQPVYLDFDADPHFMVFGDTESGKSGLLRLLARRITARYTPAQAAILVVDYRRSLLGVVASEHLLDYCGGETNVLEAVTQVQVALTKRLPGNDITAEQLRNRDWWSGPEVFVLVDDYDLVATSLGNPLATLAPLLPHAKDIGLHLVLARRSGGASRAMFEPVLQRLVDLATPGLLLSASGDEGALLGKVKPGPQPPGRGHLVSRRAGTSLVQLAWLKP